VETAKAPKWLELSGPQGISQVGKPTQNTGIIPAKTEKTKRFG
jgi:hypothetical protein